MVQQLPTRAEVPENLTWDLSTIFKTDADWEQAYQAVTAQAQETAKLQGTLGQSAASLLAGTKAVLATYRELEKVYVYASMKSDQDTTNDFYHGLDARGETLATNVSSQLAFYDPEVLAIPAETLQNYLDSTPELKKMQHYFDDITVNRAHVLSAAQEALIAAAGDALGASRATFNILDNSDIQFGVVQDEKGNDVQLSNGVYGRLLESTNRAVREAAFKGLYKAYGDLRNTFAGTLSGNIKAHNFSAKAHHFEDARAAAMANNHIPAQVFDTLVEQVNQHLDLLHRYVALRKKVLKVDQLHSYDLYTPITGEPSLSYTFPEAKAEALKALSVMGPDYLSHVKDIFNNRMIDVVENKGKRSGAYSGGAYDTNPFELLNWQDNLNNLYTLVHETGHSVHSWYTRHNQPYVYGDYPIFVAEIASTTNENTLTNYLLSTQKDPKVRAYILNYYLDGFKGTIFRQTQFAEFEHFIHQQDQKGQPLTAKFMSEYYADLNARYYGDALERDPEIALEWSRIPHFYMNYYVYQYATGFAAASALSSHITEKQPHALENYINYLKTGRSKSAIDTMKGAGVDMTQPDYLIDAFNVFETRLNELESLLG